MLTRLRRSVEGGVRDGREVRRLHGVGIMRQLARWLALRRRITLSRHEFHCYRLWRGELDAAERLAFSTVEERRVVGRLVNPLEARSLTHIKSRTQALFAAHGIPGPELLGSVVPGGGAGRGAVTTMVDLAALLHETAGAGVVIKPEAAMQGVGVLVCRSGDRAGVRTFDGHELALPALWARLESSPGREWRVERLLRPDRTLPALSAGQVLTLRVFTVVVGGRASVQAATLKVPLTPDGVDNIAHGNLGAAVDLLTGRLGPAFGLTGTCGHDRHPVTGAAITGEGVPGIDDLLALACRAAETVHPLRAVGWDLALAEGGAVVLEGNVPGSAEIVQRPQDRGYMRGPFLRMLHEVGGTSILGGRRRVAAWRRFEAAELAGEAG